MHLPNDASIVIRCAGRGLRCRRVLGVARLVPMDRPRKHVLWLTNEGWATRNGVPLLEDVVPADFSGSTRIFGCKDHNFVVTERSTDPALVPGLPKGNWTQGVPFPYSLLQSPYEKYLRRGLPEEVLWVPAQTLAAG